MEFELTYMNGTKVNIEVPDIELKEWLYQKAEHAAQQQAERDRVKWGIITAVKVVAP